MLSFTPDDMKTISSGMNVMTELCKIAAKDGTSSNGVNQMYMAFVVDCRSEISHVNKQHYILFFWGNRWWWIFTQTNTALVYNNIFLILFSFLSF